MQDLTAGGPGGDTAATTTTTTDLSGAGAGAGSGSGGPGEPSATVQTSAGAVRGFRLGPVHAYLAVPYAAPPVGDRRFGPPAPPDPWDGTRPATTFGPTAPQPRLAVGLVPQELVSGDDYLHVNVYTPDPGAAGLPVLVNIHGGGLVVGSNIDRAHGPAQLAARGMVVVSINYRLGFEGFLSLEGATTNRGVLDWLQALQWVRDEVPAFGGDPQRVTIMGYSSGSAACGVLMGLPRATGLFGQAIAMSGTPWNVVDLAESEARAAEVAARLGVTATADGFASVPVGEALALQDELAPLGGIGAITDPLATFGHLARLRGWLGPVVDGDLVPQQPMAAVAAGATDRCRLMTGCTASEMDALLGIFGGSVERPDADAALEELGLDGASTSAWFAGHVGRTPGQALGAALTALSFRLPLLRLAEARSGRASTHVYEFAWQPPTPLGAVHGIDVPFAFDTVGMGPDADGVAMLCGGEPPRSLAEDLSGAIARFVIDGDPGWAPYELDARHVMAFDVPSSVQLDPERDRLVRTVFAGLR